MLLIYCNAVHDVIMVLLKSIKITTNHNINNIHINLGNNLLIQLASHANFTGIEFANHYNIMFPFTRLTLCFLNLVLELIPLIKLVDN